MDGQDRKISRFRKQANEAPASPSESSISWTALEFDPQERSAWWYAVFFVIAAALIGYGVYTKSTMTIVLFSILTVVTLGFALKRPRRLGHILGPTGVTVGHTFFPYRDIKKFWIHYNPPVRKTLNFQTTAYVNNTVTLQLENQDPIAVKLYLKKYLAEDLDQEESLADAIARKLKF